MQLTFLSVSGPIYIGAMLLLSRARSVLLCPPRVYRRPAQTSYYSFESWVHLFLILLLLFKGGRGNEEGKGKIRDHLFSLPGPILWFRAWDVLHVAFNKWAIAMIALVCTLGPKNRPTPGFIVTLSMVSWAIAVSDNAVENAHTQL